MDRGYYLRATARYTDPLRTEDDPTTAPDERIVRRLAENRDGDNG